MRFRDFVEAMATLNPHMYDMSTEVGRKEYEDDLTDLKDMYARRQERGKIVSRERKSEPITITCWRGGPESDFRRDLVQQGNGWIVLGGENAQEGILWFTHSLQQSSSMGFNPRDYAMSHAEDYLITYPLKVIKHYDLVTYSNGKTETYIANDLVDQADRSSSSNLAALDGFIYEVPEPWKFTWQVQKHLGTTRVKIYDSMIKRLR